MMKNGIFETLVSENDFAANKKVLELGLPTGSWIIFLKRNGTFIIPDGSTTLIAGDKALVVTREKHDIELAKGSFLEKRK